MGILHLVLWSIKRIGVDDCLCAQFTMLCALSEIQKLKLHSDHVELEKSSISPKWLIPTLTILTSQFFKVDQVKKQTPQRFQKC